MSARAISISVGLAVAAAFAVVGAVSLKSNDLIADISEEEIRITTGFSGAELLLFGVTDPDGDVIVIVSGPDTNATVRKKERVAGIWINTRSVSFPSVPSFFHVAATARYTGTDLNKVLAANGIGLRYLNLTPDEGAVSSDEAEVFRQALVRNKERQGLYTEKIEGIERKGGQLFRTSIGFPSSTPVGEYRVDVYHVKDGWVTASTSTPLAVNKDGLEAEIFRYANEQPALYGAFAIAIALMAGWLAGAVFRNV